MLPVPITVPAAAKPGQTVTLDAAGRHAGLRGDLRPRGRQARRRPAGRRRAQAQRPKWGARWSRRAGRRAQARGPGRRLRRTRAPALKLAITGAPLKGADLAEAYFFPFDGTVIDHAKPQAIERGPRRPDPDADARLRLPEPDAAQGAGRRAVAGRHAPMRSGRRAGRRAGRRRRASAPPPPPSGRRPARGGGLGLPLALAFAFLGGADPQPDALRLPGAVDEGGVAGRPRRTSRATARRQGLAFAGGVLATFLALAAAC